MEILKVSAKSNPNSVAGALAGVLRENGSAEMFLGATLILTPTEHNRPETVQAMYELARILGFARVRKVDPIEHDRLIAYTSQMPHVLAAVLMQAWSGD